MASKPELPSMAGELAQPRARPNLAAMRSREEVPDSIVEANSRVIGTQWVASTRLPEPEPETILSSIRLDIPDYVDKQLKLRIVEDGGTKAHYILKGLAAIGFNVNEIDLKLDRRKRGQK
jgi:hypothetical protein